MKNIKLQTIFFKNLFHIIICLLPFIACLIISIVLSGSLVWILLTSILLVLIVLSQINPILTNCQILFDFYRKKTHNITCKLDNVSPDWNLASFTTKRKYIQDLFKQNYWHIIKINPLGSDIPSLKLYVKESELKKTNFYKHYRFAYGYKKQFVEKISNLPVSVNVEFYNHSKIIKNIIFL